MNGVERGPATPVASWAAVGSAGLALLAAAAAGGFSLQATKARDAAELAASRAQAARDDARSAAEAARALTESLRQPTSTNQPRTDPGPLTLEPDSGVQWKLRNSSDTEMVVEALVNADDFVRRPIALPATIPPAEAIEVVLVEAWGSRLPETMTLRLNNRTDTVSIPLPS